MKNDAFLRLSGTVSVSVLLVGVGLAFSLSGIPLALLSVLLGFLLSTCLPIIHEAAHCNLSTNRAVNNLVGNIAGAILFISFPVYRRTHLAHHARLGTPDDGEIPTRIGSWVEYVLHLSPWYFLIPFWRTTLQSLTGRYGREARKVAMVFVLPFAAAIGFVTMAYPVEAVSYYWAPLWLSAAFMFLTTLHEHYGSDETGVVTRSVTCSPVLAWFLWNSHLHEEHHAQPAVPYDKLPEIIPDESQQRLRYLQFHLALLKSLPFLPKPKVG